MANDRNCKHLRSFSRDALTEFLTRNGASLIEEEAVAVLENPNVTPAMCQAIARTPHLAAINSVRLRLVQSRSTPLTHSVKLVHYLHWPDLLRLSIDVKVPAQVRRAIDTQLLVRLETLSLGEKIAAAKRCSAALMKVLLFDPDPKVFAALLVNARLREEDLLLLASSDRASAEKLRLLAADQKWSYRYAIRRALAVNPATPRSVAASQLRFLPRRDLRILHDDPATSTYLRRCIERIEPLLFARATERID
ncbi:MAG TPA: hypothetical protein VGQ46_05620 [Thermoanaerobaculia bacterium]|jgi:hypothetical protein|nr:hypothetical protein [Thermoanaerobaculia bacterium]